MRKETLVLCGLKSWKWACPATQKGQGCGSLSEASFNSLCCVSKQWRLWRDCADAQARLSFCYLPIRSVPMKYATVKIRLHVAIEICKNSMLVQLSMTSTIVTEDHIWHVWLAFMPNIVHFKYASYRSCTSQFIQVMHFMVYTGYALHALYSHALHALYRSYTSSFIEVIHFMLYTGHALHALYRSCTYKHTELSLLNCPFRASFVLYLEFCLNFKFHAAHSWSWKRFIAYGSVFCVFIWTA